MSPALSVAEVEAAVRNERLKREREVDDLFARYEQLCQRVRAERGQS